MAAGEIVFKGTQHGCFAMQIVAWYGMVGLHQGLGFNPVLSLHLSFLTTKVNGPDLTPL